ncbi:MAG: MFS transporter [Acidobacteria bacterium]|nr:MFS transporter [Acidobacteriota bacterium]
MTLSASRWWIAGLLFASTTINYLDRQTLSVLAPSLKTEFQWSNTQFALIVMAFRAAYAVGQTLSGRMLDRLGTRLGLMLSVGFYSFAAMATSLAQGLVSFAALRFLLGLGESGNWPGAAKAVARWFPARERGLAVAIYDSGSAIGAAVAPALVLALAASTGSWRLVFVIIGALGLLWMLVWWRSYPAEAPPPVEPVSGGPKPQMNELLRQRRTWGLILGRSLTDPVWFFISDWFAVFLVSRGFRLEDSVAGFWVPFLAADFGNFFGGWLSGRLIRAGWSVTGSRLAIIVAGSIGMTALIPAAYAAGLGLLVSLFAVATFSYAALSTMYLTLPGDLYPDHSVATVSGLTGTGAGIGTILSTLVIGIVADRYSFVPILTAASFIPLAGVVLTLWLLRKPREL